MSKKLGIFANWKPKGSHDSLSISWVHQKYLEVLSRRFSQVYIVTSSDLGFKEFSGARLSLENLKFLSVPLYFSFISGWLRFPFLIFRFVQLLVKSDCIYIRYPEPCVSLLILLNLYFKRNTYLHFVSDPVGLLASRSGFASKISRILIVADIYIINFFISFQADRCFVSYNGVQVPSFLSDRFSVPVKCSVESSFSSRDSLSTSYKEREEGESLELVCLSRLVNGKGILELIDILLAMNFEVNGCRISLRIYGSGPFEHEIQRHLEQHTGAFDRVRLMGEAVGQQEVIDAIGSGHVFVVSSLSESGPRTVIESLRAGRVVVSTDVGFVKDVGYVGTTVFIYDLDSVSSFSDALTHAQGQLGYEGYLSCLENGSVHTIERFFEEVICCES